MNAADRSGTTSNEEKIMAHLSIEKNGRVQIQFRHPSGKRQTLRLGKVARRLGESVLFRVREIIAAIRTGQSVSAETAAWLGTVTPQLHDRLVRVGLAEPRVDTTASDVMLDDFVREYIDGRAKLKPFTRRNLQQSRRMLVERLGARTPLRSIIPGDADRFKEKMLADYSVATVGREIIRVRQFFKAAKRQGLIDANPFEDVKGGSQANDSRAYFVTRQVAQAVLDACPDDEWRLIFALSRFGGLRCPSETLELKLQDIDWAGNKIVIRESKTKTRTIPLFPEIRGLLGRAFDSAPDRTEYVIQRYRGATCNLRTQLLRIISRVGLTPWPRLFHNLRASRETELVREHPIHVVCAWIGNSERVARRHYLQVTDADFEKATSNPTSPMHADGRTGPHAEKETAVSPAIADHTAVLIPSTGIEPVTFSSGG
jgi:integrase